VEGGWILKLFGESAKHLVPNKNLRRAKDVPSFGKEIETAEGRSVAMVAGTFSNWLQVQVLALLVMILIFIAQTCHLFN
jgi:hypothetical protein